MRKPVPCWQPAGFMFTSILGTLLHFLFDWTGQSLPAALFSAVNESIWEHMKLIYYPMLLYALMEYRFWGRSAASFWCVKLAGMLLALSLIPTIYYTYTGILGISADWFNVTIFFIAAGAAYWLETRLFQKGCACRMSPGTALALMCLTGIAFMLLTFFPPRIPFFQDPVTGSFGYQP